MGMPAGTPAPSYREVSPPPPLSTFVRRVWSLDLPAAGAPERIVPLEEMKRQAVERALTLCEGNVDRAAAELGIGRATVYRLLKKYDLGEDD